ncbi:hypothetical protein [uncultured Nostoc sp.]|uniref:hypothetical protein n=1 Tax=uncultured Nostoc sp. TaxID=340711 RepID=UPI0035CA5FDB
MHSQALLKVGIASLQPRTRRYTNIKISYLLQKMAEYEDIAILTFVSLLYQEKSDRQRRVLVII